MDSQLWNGVSNVSHWHKGIFEQKTISRVDTDFDNQTLKYAYTSAFESLNIILLHANDLDTMWVPHGTQKSSMCEAYKIE